MGLFGIMLHNVKGVQFRCKFRGLFELPFIMTDLGNLYANFGGYFELSCVMAKVDNLDAKLEGYFMYFS